MNSHYHLLAKYQTFFTVLGIIIRQYNLQAKTIHYVDLWARQQEILLYIIRKCSPLQTLHDTGNSMAVRILVMYIRTCIGCAPGSVVGIATVYVLYGPGIESRWGGGEIFRTYPDRPWGPPSFLYNEYRVFPGGKERPGRDVDPSPPSSAVVKKEQSYTSTLPMGRTACTEPQCLYKAALYLYLWIVQLPQEVLQCTNSFKS